MLHRSDGSGLNLFFYLLERRVVPAIKTDAQMHTMFFSGVDTLSSRIDVQIAGFFAKNGVAGRPEERVQRGECGLADLKYATFAYPTATSHWEYLLP